MALFRATGAHKWNSANCALSVVHNTYVIKYMVNIYVIIKKHQMNEQFRSRMRASTKT